MSAPFRDMMSGFTPLPNEIVDLLVADPDFSGAELRLLLVILRETAGWGVELTTTSYAELREMSGIGSQSTISKALRGLEARGLVLFTPGTTSREPSRVGLNLDWNPSPADGDDVASDGQDGTCTETVPVQKVYRSQQATSPKSVQASNKRKKVLNKNNNGTGPVPKSRQVARSRGRGTPKESPGGTIHEVRSSLYSAPQELLDLADGFQARTGLFYNPGTWEDRWEKPLGAILEQAGGYEEAERLINDSIAVLREKGYTIASPQSILVAAMNLANQPEKKKESLNR